jgi:hypothetical protein
MLARHLTRVCSQWGTTAAADTHRCAMFGVELATTQIAERRLKVGGRLIGFGCAAEPQAEGNRVAAAAYSAGIRRHGGSPLRWSFPHYYTKPCLSTYAEPSKHPLTTHIWVILGLRHSGAPVCILRVRRGRHTWTARLTGSCATADAGLAAARLNLWQAEPSDDARARLFVFGYADVEQPHMRSHAHTHPVEPTSPRSNTSMTPVYLQPRRPPYAPSSTYLSGPPSLADTFSTAPGSSLHTSALSILPPLLVENPETTILERPPGTPLYPCTFHFLPCPFATPCSTVWRTHNLAHFRLNTPPTPARCPLCPWVCAYGDGWAAWNAWLGHVQEHIEAGEDVKRGSMDRGLLNFLWSRGIISNPRLMVLRGHVGTGVNFSEVNGSRARFETGRSRERRAVRGQRA